MARGRMLGRNAAFLYTDPATGQDVVIDLPAPLRDIRTRVVERRYVEEALDGTRSVKTIGPAHYELIGRIRFVDAPDAVLSMLRAAANGAQLVYTEDVTDPHAKTYAAELIWDESAIELGMDADLGKIGRGEVTVVLRSSVPWGALYAGNDVLFRYRAGEPLSAAGAAFSRASGATLIDRTGTLREVGTHVPRIDWSHGRPALRLEPHRTNWLRNPRGEGAVPGVIGSGGALPTRWGTINLGGSSGLSIEVIGTDIVDGIPATTLRVFGTIASTLALFINFEPNTGVGAEAGQTWTGSAYVRRVAGALAQGGTVALRISERQENGSAVQDAFTDQVISIDAPRLIDSWHSVSRTLTGAETAHVLSMLRITGPIGQDVDVTLQVGGAQLEQAPVPSSLILPPPGAPAPAARTVETVTVPWPHAPQPMTLYVRLVEVGGLLAQNFDRVVEIGSAPGDRIVIRVEPNQDRYQLRYDSGGQAAFRTAAAQPAPGQVVELMVPLSEAGTRLVQAIDGGSPDQTSLAALPLPSAWGTPTLTIGGGGQFDLLDFFVLRGAGWTMDQIRQRFGIS